MPNGGELINKLLPKLAEDVTSISESLERLADPLAKGEPIGY